MASRTQEQWIIWGKKHHRYVFFYENKALDLTDFVSQHPGGKKAITNYVNKDITDIIFKVYPHRKETTVSVLHRYVAGTLLKNKPKEEPPRPKTPTILDNGGKSVPKQKKKVCFDKQVADTSGKENDERGRKKKKGPGGSVSPKKKSQKMKKSNSAKKMDVSIKTIEESGDMQEMKKYMSASTNNGKNTKPNKTMGKGECSLTDFGELDEEKPDFKVPVLRIKNMSCL